MGRLRKRHNIKGREQKETKIDRTDEKRIKLDDVGGHTEHYDDCNTLALPGHKRGTKNISATDLKPKPLSKKQRRILEKIVQKKEKKLKRKDLLEALSKVQASPEEIAMLRSTADMQSNKSHKYAVEQSPGGEISINAISGTRRKSKLEKQLPEISSTEESSDAEEDSGEDIAQLRHSGVHSPNFDLSAIETKSLNHSTLENDGVCGEVLGKAVENTADKLTHSGPMTSIKPSVFVAVDRKPEIQDQRLRLPILGEEQQIMEAINENPVVVICGETGSGKTTQVPQFLYEAGYASGDSIIGVTEPRRVAAISMAHRVATEMNLTSRLVSYQIRYEGNATPDTKIKFMTDGVLLKEVQKDFMLTKYKAIIIDEAHERSVYTDILIGLLSRIVPLRHKKGHPLKLIIMSATLRVEDFTENQRLFKLQPTLVKVESRQFPVTIHFNRRTPEDYVSEALRKVCKIHSNLPDGGILVFMTGQQEVNTLCRKLSALFPSRQYTANTGGRRYKEKIDKAGRVLPIINLDNYSMAPIDEDADRRAGSNQSEDSTSDDEQPELLNKIKSDSQVSTQPMHVLPLYSLLSSDRQQQVFVTPPSDSRLCVVATNVAETSLTIPNIKYVVDTGKAKTRYYDKVTGVSTFRVTWTSQASANQRAGRAGRTSPGHCYRLYSSAVFNDEFEKFSPPEITRRPVEDLVLQMKDMNIDKVVNFPFPSPPDEASLKTAERLLTSLGALEKRSTADGEVVARISPLGRTMAQFPVSPRYAKMLSLGHQHGLLPYAIAIVSALSVQELLVETNNSSGAQQESEKSDHGKIHQLRKAMVGVGESLLLGDLMVLLKSVGAAEYTGCTPAYCQNYGIRLKAMIECRKLRKQLTNAVNTVLPGLDMCVDPKLEPPSDVQLKLLRQIVLAGLADHVARINTDPGSGNDDKKLKHSFQCMEIEDPVYIHPSSVLYKHKNIEYVVYQQIIETHKLYMKGVTVVSASWLPVLAPQQCTFSKPLEEPPPRYNHERDTVMCHVTSTYGACCWPLPAVEVDYPPNTIERYKYFAMYLLDGRVFKEFKGYTSILLTTPATMIKSWAKLQPRTETLLKALMSEDVYSRERLTKVWKGRPMYLLAAYCDWIPQALHEKLKENWPPIELR